MGSGQRPEISQNERANPTGLAGHTTCADQSDKSCRTHPIRSRWLYRSHSVAPQQQTFDVVWFTTVLPDFTAKLRNIHEPFTGVTPDM